MKTTESKKIGLKLEKLTVSKLNNLATVKGGAVLHYFNDGDWTWPDTRDKK